MMTLVEEDFKRSIFNKLSPRILEALKRLGIDQECEVRELKGVKIVLSKDATAGITTIDYGELFIKTLPSVQYREATKAVLQQVNETLIRVPSGILYKRDIMHVVNAFEQCIIKYPLKPGPILIKKTSLNIAVLLAHFSD
jgi:hypothetical protein